MRPNRILESAALVALLTSGIFFVGSGLVWLVRELARAAWAVEVGR